MTSNSLLKKHIDDLMIPEKSSEFHEKKITGMVNFSLVRKIAKFHDIQSGGGGR
jgi:hypothetical protein